MPPNEPHDDAPTTRNRGDDPIGAPVRSEQPTQVGGEITSAPPELEPLRDVPPGYTLVELLGRGGMGEVVLVEDERIGREVAIKRLRSARPDPDADTRFLREAKIQARLQHPAIAPVHELGRDATGRPYFTMQRLAGATLEQLIGQPSQRLLRAFADVCLAIAYAHEHGVIHRDIKPANIMLGDFGEVYVLDWGIARLIGDAAARESVREVPAAAGETEAGAVLGTPGYMAPEQALGYGLTPATDVYALGCVLFEILTREPLHPRGTGGAASAIARPTELPSLRGPGLAIPPELDAACVAALAEHPDDRPSARELAERVQRYLDGDRDLERRRALAADHVALARAALATDDPAHRAQAVHAGGRALALDPESVEAAELVSALILEPPRALPPALVDSLRDAERAADRVRAKSTAIGLASVLPFVAFIPTIEEVKSWPLLLGFFGAVLGMAIVSWRTYRRGRPIVAISLLSTLITAVIVSRIASPFVLTPVVVCGAAVAFYAIPWLLARPWVVIGWVLVAMAVPVVCEWTGVFDRTWGFDNDTMIIRSSVLHVTSGAIEGIALVLANLVFINVVGMFARATSRDRRTAERRLHIQAWHLRQLLPRGAVDPG